MTSLHTKAWLSLAGLAIVMGGLLFVFGRNGSYFQGWVYLGIFIGASILTTCYLMRHDPALLSRRMPRGLRQRVVTTGPYAIVRHPMYAIPCTPVRSWTRSARALRLVGRPRNLAHARGALARRPK